MADIEKVIKGLEICTAKPCYCTDCPYKKGCYLDSQEVMEDALCLLKQHGEYVDPIKPVDSDDSFTWLCNYCKGELFCGDTMRDHYCPTCGRKIKWDNVDAEIMRDEDEMDLLEISIQHHLERYNTIPEQTGCDPLLIAIFKDMFVYMKELRKRII